MVDIHPKTWNQTLEVLQDWAKSLRTKGYGGIEPEAFNEIDGLPTRSR